MALTRKLLAALGIDADKIDEIIAAHTETLEGLKEQRDRYKEDAEKLPDVQKELDELREAAEKNANNPYQAKYEDLKKEYEQYKADAEAKEIKAQKESAYRALLKSAGVSDKRIDTIVKVTAIDDIELDQNGEIKDRDAKEKAVKEEWADFIVNTQTVGAQTEKPPVNNGGPTATKTRAAEIAAKYHDELYGKGTK